MIRNTIESYRVTQHLSQADLARALGVNRATVLRWERGEIDIPHETLKRIARFFGVTPGDIIPELNAIPEEVADV